jgi:hypothetical protein
MLWCQSLLDRRRDVGIDISRSHHTCSMNHKPANMGGAHLLQPRDLLYTLSEPWAAYLLRKSTNNRQESCPNSNPCLLVYKSAIFGLMFAFRCRSLTTILLITDSALESLFRAVNSKSSVYDIGYHLKIVIFDHLFRLRISSCLYNHVMPNNLHRPHHGSWTDGRAV